MKRSLLLLVPGLLACGPFFFLAPPPLARYPERIPTRSWEQLLDDTHPAGADTADALLAATRELVEGLPSMAPAARRQHVEALIDRNQRGEFRIRLANFLLELRELSLLEVPEPALAEFLAWRLESLKKSDPAPPPVPPLADLIDEHDRRVAVAPPALQPYEQFRRAARWFHHGPAERAAEEFRAVAEGFPDHPRAEVARFMSARCALSIARQVPLGSPPDAPAVERQRALYQVAMDEFRGYLRAHPEGRFTDDATGWIGAIHQDQGNLASALHCQVRRLEIQSTREVTRSVLRECDQLIAELIRKAGDTRYWDEGTRRPYGLDFRLIARHPEVARLFVYHSLDPAAQVRLPIYQVNETADRGTLEFLRRNVTLPSAFTRSSLHALGRAVAEGERPGDPTSLLILGWAATRIGDHSQALLLFDRALADTSSDELVHGRAIALSRLGRHEASAASFGRLLDEFPDSPLSPPSRFDQAIELHQAGQSGEALLVLLELTRMVDPDRGWELPEDLYLHPEYEAIQWIDSLVQFAPRDELESALGRHPPGTPEMAFLRTVTRCRALCDGDFEAAARLLDAPDGPSLPRHETGRGKQWHPERWASLSEERWQGELADLVRTARLLRIASPRDRGRAAVHLRQARHWESLRGRVTLPLHGILDYSNSETWKLDQLRRSNARFLGIDAAEVDRQLESRDELRHALAHYLAAAEGSTEPEIVAPALEGANEALFRLAEFSLYAASRAAEDDHTALSDRLVSRLEAEFPERPETARAVRYTFLPPALLGDWMPGDYNMWNSDRRIAETLVHPARQHRPELVGERIGVIRSTIDLLPTSDEDLPEILRQLNRCRSELDALRPFLDPSELLPLSDHLDDLRAAATAEGVGIGLFQRYAELRLNSLEPPKPEGEWEPLAAHLAFLERIRRVQGDHGWPVLKGDTIPSWQDFLEEHPDSAKAEAASLRLIRLQVRRACPIPHVRAFHFPEAPIAAGYKRVEQRDASEEFDAAALLGAIDAHRKRFPAGRYRADFDLLEGAVRARAGEFGRALECYVGVLTDPAHPELLQNTSLYFSELALRLLEPEDRRPLADAFRSRPEALRLLHQLAHGDTCVSRLRPMLPWLEG